MGETDSDAPALRASDSEREHTAEQLRAHYEAGRLTADELDQRTDAAFAARTARELQALLRDLPPLPAPAPPKAMDPDRRAALRRLRHRAGFLALLCLAAVAIWLATGTDGQFWPEWVMLLAGIRLAFASWAELGPGAHPRRRIGPGDATPPRQ
jgi:Domain of unknown function (DUF1707)